MKKILSLLLAATLTFTLCACGGENKTTTELSKEEQVLQAEELDINDLLFEVKNNEARAKELYNDDLVKIDNFRIDDISSYKNHAEIEMIPGLFITARISKEDVMSLNKGDKVTVVGTLDIRSSGFIDLNDAFVVTE